MSRTALVTGGTRGIGAAIAQALHNAGISVVANYASNKAQADAFSAQTGIPVMGWDVADYEATCTAIAQIERDYGPIDIVINNAGITRDGFLHKMDLSQWRAVIDTNLGGIFNVTRAVIEGMRTRQWGRIINISSVNAQKGQMGQTNYCAAKAGVLGFTKALALENANKNIAVNAIAPGYIDTDMVRAIPEPVLERIVAGIPAGRLGQPDEIANLVLFLTQEGAGYINGATFNINGAFYL